MRCLEEQNVAEAFERSNVPVSDLGLWAAHVDALCEDGIHPDHLKEVSLVEAFRTPQGSGGSVTHLLTLFDPGVVLLKGKGLRGKKTDIEEFIYSEFPGGDFVPCEATYARGRGDFGVQAVVGSRPVFRLGWEWDAGSAKPQRQPEAAVAERDRILTGMLDGLARARR